MKWPLVSKFSKLGYIQINRKRIVHNPEATAAICEKIGNKSNSKTIEWLKRHFDKVPDNDIYDAGNRVDKFLNEDYFDSQAQKYLKMANEVIQKMIGKKSV